MIWLVILVFAFAGLIKGIIGLGLPAVAMGLLSIGMMPYQAASLLIIPSMVTNFWQLFAEGQVFALIRRFWPMLLGIVIGSLWSIFPTLGHSEFKSEALLGAMLALYGIYGLCAKKRADLVAHERWLSPVVGYLGGALTVATGVVIIPVVPYLHSLALKPNDLIQSLGLAFTTSTLCLLIFLQQNPVSDIALDYRLSAMALIPALLGMWCGKKLRDRISEAKFRQLFFIGLIALGGYS